MLENTLFAQNKFIQKMLEYELQQDKINKYLFHAWKP